MFAVVREIDQLDDVPGWLCEFRNNWFESAGVGYMGCVPTQLDQFADIEGKRKALARIGCLALERVENNVPLLKNDLWVERWDGSRFVRIRYFGEQVDEWRADHEMLSRFLRTLKMLVLLLEGQVKTTAGDPEALTFRWTAA